MGGHWLKSVDVDLNAFSRTKIRYVLYRELILKYHLMYSAP